jgi:hypothetical protein
MVCILHAGIFNKDKKMYDKGRRQIAKHLFVMMDEIDSHSDRIAFYDDENDTMIRNENGYLSACNKLMDETKRGHGEDTRINCAIRYFD